MVKPPPIGEVREADDPRGPEHALEIHLCLDTGRGNWDAIDMIGASDRVKSVSLGRADLVMDLREEPSGDLHLMPYLLQRLVIIAGDTGVQPIGGWWRATSRGLVASYEETLEAAADGRRVGFWGALCMRSYQVDALNSGFTPPADRTVWASAAVKAFTETEAKGRPETVLDGEVIDAPRASIASNVLAWAKACLERDRSKTAVSLSHNSGSLRHGGGTCQDG